jgi:hypothetical protein
MIIVADRKRWCREGIPTFLHVICLGVVLRVVKRVVHEHLPVARTPQELTIMGKPTSRTNPARSSGLDSAGMASRSVLPNWG